MKNTSHLESDLRTIHFQMIDTRMRLDYAISEADYIGYKEIPKSLVEIRDRLVADASTVQQYLALIEDSGK